MVIPNRRRRRRKEKSHVKTLTNKFRQLAVPDGTLMEIHLDFITISSVWGRVGRKHLTSLSHLLLQGAGLFWSDQLSETATLGGENAAC